MSYETAVETDLFSYSMDVQYTETTSPESSATDSWWEVSEEGSSITASPHYEHSEPLAQTNDELVNAPATGIEPPPRKKKRYVVIVR